MQRAEGPPSRLAPEPTPARPSLSPQVAFLLLAVVIGILGAIFYLTKPDAPATPTNPNAAQQQPDFSLTNEEAITRFEELHDMEIAAYRNADPTLLDQVFTKDSPIVSTVQNEIRQLVRDGVSARPRYSNLEISIIANEAGEIQLRHITIVRSQFFDKRGRDITQEEARQRQAIVWTLHLEDSQWLIHDAVITSSKPVNK